MKRKTIYIKGDDVSSKEIIDRLNRDRMSHILFEMEKIRTNDAIDEITKSAQTSMWRWQLVKLQKEMGR